MDASNSPDDGTVVVALPQRLVAGNRAAIKAAVSDALARGARHFLLDLAATREIDSSGLGSLIALSRQIRERGGELRLANLSEDLRSLFTLTRLDTLFQVGDPRK